MAETKMVYQISGPLGGRQQVLAECPNQQAAQLVQAALDAYLKPPKPVQVYQAAPAQPAQESQSAQSMQEGHLSYKANTVQEAKIQGLMAGYLSAYESWAKKKSSLTSEEAQVLVHDSIARRITLQKHTESAELQEAFREGVSFGCNGMDLVFSRSGGNAKLEELKNFFPVQRLHSARKFAEWAVQYL